MGWNDRLPTDPYLPPEEYYHNGEEEYHAWLEYVEMCLNEEAEFSSQVSLLTSQNIDPATLPTTPAIAEPEIPVRQAPSTPQVPPKYPASTPQVPPDTCGINIYSAASSNNFSSGRRLSAVFVCTTAATLFSCISRSSIDAIPRSSVGTIAANLSRSR